MRCPARTLSGQQAGMEVCFVCGSPGFCEELLVVERPALPNARQREPCFPFLAGHEPPHGASLLNPQTGSVRACVICKAFLHQQWKRYEAEDAPLVRRLYFLKRNDLRGFTGADVNAPADITAHLFGYHVQGDLGVNETSPGAGGNSENTADNSLAAVCATQNNSAMQPMYAARCTSAESNCSTTPQLELNILSSVSATAAAASMTAPLQQRSLRVQIASPSSAPTSLQQQQQHLPSEHHIRCFLCHVAILKWEGKTAYASQVLESKEFFPFFEKVTCVDGAIPLLNGATKICADCEVALSSQWRNYELARTPQTHRVYRISNSGTTTDCTFYSNSSAGFAASSVITSCSEERNSTTGPRCLLCHVFTAPSDALWLSWRQQSVSNGEAFYPFLEKHSLSPICQQQPREICVDMDRFRVRTCRSCADHLHRQWEQYEKGKTPHTQRSYNLRANTLQPMHLHQPAKQNGPIIAQCHVCLCNLHDPRGLKTVRARLENNVTGASFPFLTKLRKGSAVLGNSFPVCEVCHINLTWQWHEYERGGVNPDQRTYYYQELVCAQCRRLYADRELVTIQDGGAGSVHSKQLICRNCRLHEKSKLGKITDENKEDYTEQYNQKTCGFSQHGSGGPHQHHLTGNTGAISSQSSTSSSAKPPPLAVYPGSGARSTAMVPPMPHPGYHSAAASGSMGSNANNTALATPPIISTPAAAPNAANSGFAEALRQLAKQVGNEPSNVIGVGGVRERDRDAHSRTSNAESRAHHLMSPAAIHPPVVTIAPSQRRSTSSVEVSVATSLSSVSGTERGFQPYQRVGGLNIGSSASGSSSLNSNNTCAPISSRSTPAAAPSHSPLSNSNSLAAAAAANTWADQSMMAHLYNSRLLSNPAAATANSSNSSSSAAALAAASYQAQQLAALASAGGGYPSGPGGNEAAAAMWYQRLMQETIAAAAAAGSPAGPSQAGSAPWQRAAAAQQQQQAVAAATAAAQMEMMQQYMLAFQQQQQAAAAAMMQGFMQQQGAGASAAGLYGFGGGASGLASAAAMVAAGHPNALLAAASGGGRVGTELRRQQSLNTSRSSNSNSIAPPTLTEPNIKSSTEEGVVLDLSQQASSKSAAGKCKLYRPFEDSPPYRATTTAVAATTTLPNTTQMMFSSTPTSTSSHNRVKRQRLDRQTSAIAGSHHQRRSKNSEEKRGKIVRSVSVKCTSSLSSTKNKVPKPSLPADPSSLNHFAKNPISVLTTPTSAPESPQHNASKDLALHSLSPETIRELRKVARKRCLDVDSQLNLKRRRFKSEPPLSPTAITSFASPFSKESKHVDSDELLVENEFLVDPPNALSDALCRGKDYLDKKRFLRAMALQPLTRQAKREGDGRRRRVDMFVERLRLRALLRSLSPADMLSASAQNDSQTSSKKSDNGDNFDARDFHASVLKMSSWIPKEISSTCASEEASSKPIDTPDSTSSSAISAPDP